MRARNVLTTLVVCLLYPLPSLAQNPAPLIGSFTGGSFSIKRFVSFFL